MKINLSMKHPNPEIQQNQNDFLKSCPDDEREFHARLFRIGNAIYRYHSKAFIYDDNILHQYYYEWLEGLPENVKTGMLNKGFQYCKTALPFTRYVNEREDLGLHEWLKQHLSTDDYEAFITKTLHTNND